jgi:hypothetical protein
VGGAIVWLVRRRSASNKPGGPAPTAGADVSA